MCLVAGCVRLFLDRQEPNVITFCNDFAQLRVSDEKTDSLESFLQLLATELEKDIIWQGKKTLYYSFSPLLKNCFSCQSNTIRTSTHRNRAYCYE